MRLRLAISSFVFVLVLILVLAAGLWLGGHPSQLPDNLRSVFVAKSDGQAFQEVSDLIQRDYYRKVDHAALLDSSIEAAVKSLNDPYSTYIAPKLFATFQNSTEGQFEGIGVTINPVPEGLKIVSVIADSPAAKGGLKPDEIIIAVNGQSIAGKKALAESALIRGPAGTFVTLTVQDGAVRHNVRLRRENVHAPVVIEKLLQYRTSKVGYIDLVSFTTDVHTQVRSALERLLKEKARAVILDLRDNLGGLFYEAVDIASLFIRSGTIVSTRGRTRADDHVYKATGGVVAPTIPMAVLVNGYTASSSEIVSGALRDHNRAVLVGEHTYGKGVFQELTKLNNGGGLDITIGEYFTPDGRNLGGGGVKQGAGITPDITVAQPPRARTDQQLQRALQAVGQKIR